MWCQQQQQVSQVQLGQFFSELLFIYSSREQPQSVQFIDTTLRNKKNHYNVKFLKGYDFSINATTNNNIVWWRFS